MKREIIEQAKTSEAAIAQGAAKLGVDVSAVTYEILEEAKKGLFGLGASPAKVRVTYVEKPDEVALAFIKTLLADMELDASVSMSDTKDGEKLITVEGENAGVLIGHHGDTLDAIQYLANLAANRKEDEDRCYTKITLDVENYRAKREDTLRQLAKRMAEKVLKYKKAITLEPMNPYERRIIHSEVQSIEGVSTNSIGTENNRRIVLFLTAASEGAESKEAMETALSTEKEERPAKKSERGGRGGDRNGRGRGRGRGGRGAREEYVAEKPNRPLKTVDREAEEAAAAANAEIFERAKAEKEAAAANEPPKAPSKPSRKKPYYVNPKPTGERTYQKPVKKDSVESYYFDLENSMSGLKREKEEPSAIAKACGIYDDPIDETPANNESAE
ncbi:MAG: protein jag [Clostridia bacterium]|nr:protein jag [Clostridia bacterium]